MDSTKFEFTEFEMSFNNSKNRFLIIDSGLRNLGGHNYTYTRAVQLALAERGFETDVLTSNKLTEDLAKATGFKPTFSQGAYDFSPISRGMVDDLLYTYSQSIIFSRDIEKIFANELSCYAGIFCHTIADFELIAWNRFISRNKLDSQLFLLLRSTYYFNQASFLKRNFSPFLRIKPHYLNSIHKKLKDKFTVLTDSEALTREYSKIYRHKIVTMPIPINEYFLIQTESQNISLEGFKDQYGLTEKKGLCVGYMGDAREVKGFYLLPELVRNIINKDNRIKFLFQCPKPSSGQDQMSLPSGVIELNEIAEKFPDRVVLVGERLSEIDYSNMFRCLDIVLIPYPLPGYREATSGVFAEAVALGKPTIVTEDTWMANELKKFNGGLEVKSNNVDDLTAKVFELVENYNYYAEKAQAYSIKWREFHNSHKLAEMLVAEIK